MRMLRSSESLHEVSRASARAASLTRQLLAFSRKQMLHRRPLDLREALNNLGKMLQRIIGEHIYLRIQCAENLPLVFADAVNLEQIVINLAVNARDAMPRGGPLAITAEPVVIDAEYQERVPDAMVGNLCAADRRRQGSGHGRDRAQQEFSSRFSPPRKSAREPEWDWPRFMASSNSIRDGLRLNPNCTSVRCSRSFSRWPDRGGAKANPNPEPIWFGPPMSSRGRF